MDNPIFNILPANFKGRLTYLFSGMHMMLANTAISKPYLFVSKPNSLYMYIFLFGLISAHNLGDPSLRLKRVVLEPTG